jgi:hypothetical protein
MKSDGDNLVSQGGGNLVATFFIKFTFFAFGVSSISGWNAVLTAMDYFDEQYPGINISFS